MRVSLRLVCLLAMLLPAPVMAIDYPTAAVKIVVPFPPGGSSDLVARLVGAHLASRWKQPVIIDNRPGGNGMLGPTAVSKMAPDGYSLLLAPPSIASVAATMKSPPIDPMKDLSPISHLAESPLVVIVHGKLPIQSLKELITQAKAKPGAINSGTYAMGARLYSGRFDLAAGIETRNVGYRGEALMIAAVAAGEIEMGVAAPVGLTDFVSKGQLKILAVSSDQRLPAFPDVPTAREAGLPDFDPTGWFALFAPPGTPLELRKTIAEGVAEWAATKDAAEKLATAGFTPKASTPEQMAEFLARETRLANETAVRIGLEKQ